MSSCAYSCWRNPWPTELDAAMKRRRSANRLRRTEAGGLDGGDGVSIGARRQWICGEEGDRRDTTLPPHPAPRTPAHAIVSSLWPTSWGSMPFFCPFSNTYYFTLILATSSFVTLLNLLSLLFFKTLAHLSNPFHSIYNFFHNFLVLTPLFFPYNFLPSPCLLQFLHFRISCGHVPLKTTLSILRRRNGLHCVGWGVKLYSLTQRYKHH